MRKPEIDALAGGEVIHSEPASDMAETAVIEVQMPQMGESVTEGTILEWHVSEGEEVAEGDTVVEVSTDKIDAEVPAPASGVITKILAQPDDTVEVGQVLAQIDPNGTPRATASATPIAAQETTAWSWAAARATPTSATTPSRRLLPAGRADRRPPAPGRCRSEAEAG